MKSVFRGYLDFRGRSRRSEFWWWAAIQLALVFAVYLAGLSLYAIAYGAAYEGNAEGAVVPAVVSVAVWGVLTVYLLLTLCPTLAVAVRRLHDVGRSGWWLALYFVPLAGLVLLVLWALPSQQAANRWGLPPN